MDLDALCAAAEAALPLVRISRATFGAWLATHEAGKELLAGATSDIDATTEARAAELWLACGIAHDDGAAARAFEERYVSRLDTTLGRMRLAPPELDEVKQLVRTKLLVKDASGHARLEAYAGRGRMEGLVQVVATREAVSLLRRTRAESTTDDDELAGPLADPGLEALKAKYRRAFRVAFGEAVSALSPKERNLLRLHVLGGVALEQLASMQGVHRATVVRWLKEAREAVLDKTMKTLGATLGVRADELPSLHALAESRLDASIERVFRTHDGEGDGDH
jgi:RNA polymerase sigma-70 factor, ECF subfamily